MIPKQIIYPIDYARALFGGSSAEVETKRFQELLGQVIGDDIPRLPLGRARMGIYLLVRSVITTGRNKVILSPYTIPDVVNMVVLAGGSPVFVDFVPRSTNVDVNHLQELIGEDVACVLITHYHVNQSGFALIRDLCEQNGVRLFEDCAIALSGTIAGRHVGTESDGGILSLSGFKSLNYFWGGCVFSRHPEVIERLELEVRQWKRLGRRDYLPQVLKTLQYDVATRPVAFDLVVFPLLKARQRRSLDAVNLSPPRIESLEIDDTLRSLPSASALSEWNSKFGRLAGFLAHRRRIAAIYDEYLGDRMVSAETSVPAKSGSCFVNYPVYVGPAIRNIVYKRLILGGVDVGASLYPNCHQHQRFRDAQGKSTNVDDLVRSVITLPTHPKVDERYARRLATTVARAIEEAPPRCGALP